MLHKSPKLTLVGAGPGDPDLFTIKGIKALQSADVVLYDALANADLLDYTPKEALKIFVGKRKGQHSFDQTGINELIVHCAYKYGHVIRLKGGDPFVFGRGSEEIAYAEQQGVATAVVPGISSAFGVPASLHIPLTERGVAESFWVLTGTTTSHQLTADIHLALQSSATLVILMGMARLPQIMDEIEKYGRGDVPVAVIQNGTTISERHCIGAASEICNLVAQYQIGNPAIIVIGEVVKCSKTWPKIKTQLAYV